MKLHDNPLIDATNNFLSEARFFSKMGLRDQVSNQSWALHGVAMVNAFRGFPSSPEVDHVLKLARDEIEQLLRSMDA